MCTNQKISPSGNTTRVRPVMRSRIRIPKSASDNKENLNQDEESPLTPVSEIPLISNDWYSSDDILENVSNPDVDTMDNITDYSPVSNPESSKRRDSYAGTVSTHWTSNMGDTINYSPSADTIDCTTDYSPNSRAGSSRHPGSYTGTANTQWTSNIDAQSSIFIADPNSTSSSEEKERDTDDESEQSRLRFSKVIDSMKLKLSIDEPFSTTCRQRRTLHEERKSNSLYGDDVTESSRIENPHPHYKLFQKRLNNLVFNIDHLSFIYRHRLCKR